MKTNPCVDVLRSATLSLCLLGGVPQGMASALPLDDTAVVQQSVKVTGVVNDAFGSVIGASIVEKGNPSNGTVTDLDGRFALEVKPGASRLTSSL